MIKKDIVETVYEYDKEGKLVKKTVIETHEEEDNTITTYPSWSYLNGTEPYCGSTGVTKLNCDKTLTTATSEKCTITG